MKIYIVRHGADDNSIRGGWSNAHLTSLGIEQAKSLAETIKSELNRSDIGAIVSSDLSRAMQTAEIIANAINVNVKAKSEFREVNNGDLAGMDNELAEKFYPNLYWRSLDWEQQYPNGESPKEFYDRIYNAWNNLKIEYADGDKNIMLITHSGVINVIKAIEKNIKYSNKEIYSRISCCTIDCIFEI